MDEGGCGQRCVHRVLIRSPLVAASDPEPLAGEAEASLAALRSTLPIATYFFRPAPVQPVTPGYFESLSYLQSFRLYVLARFVIRADVIARAMIEAVLDGASGEISGWPGKGLPGNEHTFGIGEMKELGARSVLAGAA